MGISECARRRAWTGCRAVRGVGRDDYRIAVGLETAEKVAAIAFDAGEELITEVAEVEDEQAVFDPRPSTQHRSVVLAFTGDFDRAATGRFDAHDRVQLERGLGV